MRADPPCPIRAFVAAAALATGAVACSDSPPPAGLDAGAPSSDAGPVDRQPEPALIDTVAPESVRAGEVLEVSCVLRDEHGEELYYPEEPDFRVRISPASATERQDDGRHVAIRAGALEVVCSLPEKALLDESSPIVEVRPGPVATITTSVDPEHVIAGGEVTARCDAYDAWDNAIDDVEAELRVFPARGENEIEGMVATLARAGDYEIVCDRPGASSHGAAVGVSPGPPASLVISRVPSRPIYGVGEIIEIDSLALDAYGNELPEAEVAITSIPEADVSAGSRLRYLDDGVYQITATAVHPAPAAGEPPSASTTITVDGSGPAIACNAPEDGAILERAPGEPITFEGTAADLSGVTEVRVNGELVALDGSGAFSVSVPTRFGINFVRLSAIDELDRESTRTCSFLVAESFSEEDRELHDAVAMALTAAAVDDGTRQGPMRSLADVLFEVLNSEGLHQAIHEMLLENNPIKPSSCDQRVLGACVLRTELEYIDSVLPGPNEVGIELDDGGFTAQLVIPDATLELFVSGTASGIPFSSTGTVTVDETAIALPVDAYFAAGRPRVSVRDDDVVVSIGSIDSDFSGLSGWFIDIVISLAQGTVRDILEEQIAGLITDSLGELLDDLLAHLDIGALASTLEVPRLDGGDPIPLRFDPGLSSLDAGSERMLFGLSTRFSAPVELGRSSPGAPIELPRGPRDAGAALPVGVALHAGILNQVMHALWRAAFFKASLELGEAGDTTVSIDTGLPPVVTVAGTDDAELSLGNVTASLHDPQLFPDPIELAIGLRARLRVAASAEEVAFHDFALEEIYLTSFSVSLDTETREILEDLFGDILSEMIEQALVEALPALPVPSFTLPEAVAEYGLPEGAELGLEEANLSMESPFVMLRGALGLK